jgi:hypothetical protein
MTVTVALSYIFEKSIGFTPQIIYSNPDQLKLGNRNKFITGYLIESLSIDNIFYHCTILLLLNSTEIPVPRIILGNIGGYCI